MQDQSAQRLWLSKSCHLCIDGEYAVILDLHADRYVALDHCSTSGFRDLVSGWPIDDDKKGCVPRPAIAHDRLLRDLTDRGVLTADRSRGKDASPIKVKTPLRSLLTTPDLYLPVKGPDWLDTRTVAAFASAIARASLALRFVPILRIVKQVELRRRQSEYRQSQFDPEWAAGLVERFQSMRVFVFSTKDNCLLGALALVHFLSSFGLFPQWIFGARAKPFSAHCWVQHEEFVFDDLVSHVRMFTPILAT